MDNYVPYRSGFTPEAPDLPPNLQGDPNAQVPYRLPAQAVAPPPRAPVPDAGTQAVTDKTVKQAKVALANQGVDFNAIAQAAAAKFNIPTDKIETLSDKDKYRMLLQMGINMMAASSIPGQTTAGSVAAGLKGYTGEETALKAEKMAAYKAQQEGARQAGADAAKYAGFTEASKRNALRDALYKQQIIQQGQRAAHQGMQYKTDANGRLMAINGSNATPVTQANGLPMIQSTVNPRDVANFAAKIRGELSKSFNPSYNGKTFGELSPEDQDAVISSVVERQFGKQQSDPYGAPVGATPDMFVQPPDSIEAPQ